MKVVGFTSGEKTEEDMFISAFIRLMVVDITNDDGETSINDGDVKEVDCVDITFVGLDVIEEDDADMADEGIVDIVDAN